ncbi:hypothetical protein [Hyphomonas sp. GM-8P]|jgi:hypothetical protein|uniref:hypothetical protein n=1 Tax=Hyphomonas sp. GM-8P TaxID=1280945 RepID=UPI000DBFDF09|nr:hypothetical protein [Hyphomonas sp. GM-8P]RAN40197.1 hypothetical protein HY26_12780 [Hyphomonas sp. GM-8P]
MTQRILSSLKSFVLTAAFRMSASESRLPDEGAPEPRTRHFNPEMDIDEWMFDRDGNPVTESATLYARETARVSGALSGLRSLLTQIAMHAPQTEELPAEAAFGPIMSDDLLFDGEPMPAQFGILADDDDLFDEMPTRRTAWSDSQDMPRVA